MDLKSESQLFVPNSALSNRFPQFVEEVLETGFPLPECTDSPSNPVLTGAEYALPGHRHAIHTLERQIFSSIDPRIQEEHWRCQIRARLHTLSAYDQIQFTAESKNWAQLFDLLSALWKNEEVLRLKAIYQHRLIPLILENFSSAQGVRLQQSLKYLMALRLLGVPYKTGCPLTNSVDDIKLLTRLHVLCEGHGLMAWGEGKDLCFVVEDNPQQLLSWIIQRASCFLGSKERDKIIADALWATLFPESLLESDPVRCWISESGDTFSISGEAHSGREGVWVNRGGDSSWYLVFESPWKQDRGCQVQHALEVLPPDMPKDRIAIWEPASLSPDESDLLVRSMSVSKALSYARSQCGQDIKMPWIVSGLHRVYIGNGKQAFHTILGCYKAGRVITDRGIQAPVFDDLGFLKTIEQVAIQMAGTR